MRPVSIGRVGGDGGGDDLALGAQALALRVDQPGMILAQIEDAAEQDGEADGVGEDDAALQGLGDEADERPGGQEIVEVDAPRQGAHADRRDARGRRRERAQCAG